MFGTVSSAIYFTSHFLLFEFQSFLVKTIRTIISNQNTCFVLFFSFAGSSVVSLGEYRVARVSYTNIILHFEVLSIFDFQ